MQDQMLGLKEIYNLIIKATYDLEIQGKKIKAGEPIVVFDRLQMANFQEISKRVDAKGGANNTSLVTWESTEEVALHFTQGVFSRLHFAIMGNSNITTKKDFLAPREIFKVEVDENLEVELKEVPVGKVYVYSARTGEPVESTTIENKLICNGIEAYTEIDVYYDFLTEQVTMLEIGKQLLNGFISLQAKTRLKDDRTGNTVTGIFKIPKAKLVSDFSIRLGKEVSPGIGSFSVSAIPTGSRGNEKVMDFIILNDDIDSDI